MRAEALEANGIYVAENAFLPAQPQSATGLLSEQWKPESLAVRKSLTRNSLKLLGILVGPGLFAYLIFRAGPHALWQQVHAVGWGLAVIVLLGGVPQLIRTWSWRNTFTCNIGELSWSRSLGTQLASDALGQLGFAGKLVGEGVRVSLVDGAVPLASAISSSAIDGALHVLTAALVTISGIGATFLIVPLPASLRTYAELIPLVLAAVVVLTGVSVARGWRLMGHAARTLARVPRLHDWVSSKLAVIDEAELNLLNFYREAPGGFARSAMLNALWHVFAVFEVFLILRFMGDHIAAASALALEGLTKVINLVGSLTPGNVGMYEGGNMLIARLFGVTGTAGLTLALCRRARGLFWAVVGLLSLLAMKRAGRQNQAGRHCSFGIAQSCASPD